MVCRYLQLPSCRSAVHINGRSGHEARGFRSQEDGGISNFFDTPPTAQADMARSVAIDLFGVGVGLMQHLEIAFGFYRAGGDAIDTDIVRGPLEGEGRGEVDHRRFRSTVVRHEL